MQITETLNEGLKRELKITIDEATIEQAIDAKLQEIGQQVKMPGFRPGKVPTTVLKQRYSQQVMGEVLEKLVDETSHQALNDKAYQPAMRPNVKIVSFEEGQPLVFEMSFELMPPVPAVDLGKISVEKRVFKVADKDVEEGLKRLGEANKALKPIEKARKAKKGDILRIDFEGKIDGVAFDGGKAEGFTIEIGSNQLIPGFEDQLVGLAPSDTHDVKVTFPENYHAENLKGKDAVFAVKVNEILQAELPTIDDAFAQKIGFETVVELKSRISEKIRADVDDVVRVHLKKALFDVLDEKLSFDLPASMVEEEFKGIWSRLSAESKSEGDEAQKAEMRKVAERRVKLGLYLADIAKQQKLSVNPQELQKAVLDQARMYPGQEAKVIEFYRSNPSELTMLQGPILEEKAVDYVLTQVKIVEKSSTIDEIIAADMEADAEATAKTSGKKPAKASAKKSAKKDDADQGDLL